MYRLSKTFIHSGHILQAVQNLQSFWSRSTGSPKLSVILVTRYRLPDLSVLSGHMQIFIYSVYILQVSKTFMYLLQVFQPFLLISAARLTVLYNWLKCWLIFPVFHPPVTSPASYSCIVITLLSQTLPIHGHTSKTAASMYTQACTSLTMFQKESSTTETSKRRFYVLQSYPHNMLSSFCLVVSSGFSGDDTSLRARKFSECKLMAPASTTSYPLHGAYYHVVSEVSSFHHGDI